MNEPVLVEENVLQKSTDKVKTFEPSKSMLKWLETAFELGYTASISDVSRESGLDRTNWYQWLDKEGFVDWWDNQWQKHLRGSRWRLDAIGMKKAEDSYDYWKTMQERTGNLVPQVQGPNQNNLQINIGNDELKRIIED